MELSEIQQKIEELLNSARQECEQNTSSEDLVQIKTKYLGRKGELSQIMRLLSEIPIELRPKVGQLVNQAKDELEKLFSGLMLTKRPRPLFDPTLPGRKRWRASIHPIRQVLNEIVDIFYGMGFSIASGPEIETEYYNFDALNTPEDHPARDIQDTFYLPQEGMLLRTQTSPVQIRVMESQKPPVRIIAPGRCFRRDAVDATHYYSFHQVEGLYVDRDVTLADLKGILATFARELMGKDIKVRFRPHFFPFTEPSVEYDFSCPSCGGKGCRICKFTGWLEISGAGMVDPEVFKAVGYDPDIWQGLAWGMGVERIAMVKFGIDDIRLFYENDIAFLEQF